MQHYTRVPVAIGNAGGAAVPNQRSLFEIPNRAHWLLPGIAAPNIEIPVHVKALVSAITGEVLGFLEQVAFHVGHRSFGIVHRECAPEIVDSLKGRDQFPIGEVHEIRTI